jgi:hypothetical protein
VRAASTATATASPATTGSEVTNGIPRKPWAAPVGEKLRKNTRTISPKAMVIRTR